MNLNCDLNGGGIAACRGRVKGHVITVRIWAGACSSNMHFMKLSSVCSGGFPVGTGGRTAPHRWRRRGSQTPGAMKSSAYPLRVRFDRYMNERCSGRVWADFRGGGSDGPLWMYECSCDDDDDVVYAEMQGAFFYGTCLEGSCTAT